MRILLVCHGLPPESLGGVEQHVDGLARALCAAGHDVHVFARTGAPGRPQGELLHGGLVHGGLPHGGGQPAVTRAVYRWEGLTGLPSIYDCTPMAAVLGSFVAAERAAGRTFDVAHVHHLTGLSADALAALGEAGVPTVLTLHDYWLQCPRGQMWHVRGEPCERVEPDRCGECLHRTFPHWVTATGGPQAAAAVHARARATLAHATRLVLPSARALDPWLALGVPAGRFTVVQNGVDTDALAALPAPACGPGPLRLGYLGTLIPSKGLHVLLDAVSRVARQRPRAVELRVHGNVVPYHGDETYPLRCFGQLGPDGAVSFHGPYDRGALPRILAELDVVCAPALWREVFGLTVREALAAGRPVLASRIGGLQDAVKDGVEGRLLPPGDAAAWAAAIEALAADRSAVRAMAARTRPRARGFAAMAEELTAVYRDAARAPAPRGHA